MRELIRIFIIAEVCRQSQSYLEAVGRYAKLFRAANPSPVATAEKVVDT